MHGKFCIWMTGIAILAVLNLPASCLADGENNLFAFVQICDPQLGFSDYSKDKQSLMQAVAQANCLGADFAVICGDMVNNADARSIADFKEIISVLQIPYYCVPGNHDIGSKLTAESLQTYRGAFGRDFFSIEHKGAVFLFVNTQLWKEPLASESEKQNQWLKESLKKAFDKNEQIFVVGHYPLFSKDPNEPDDYMNLPLEKRKELLNLFEQYNAAAYLGGHTHKLIINKYKQMQLVNGEALSKNFDGRPLGLRIWYVRPPFPPRHEFVALDKNNP